MGIRDKIEQDPLFYVLAMLATGFMAGVGAYTWILNAADMKTVRKDQYEVQEKKLVELEAYKRDSLSNKLIEFPGTNRVSMISKQVQFPRDVGFFERSRAPIYKKWNSQCVENSELAFNEIGARVHKKSPSTLSGGISNEMKILVQCSAGYGLIVITIAGMEKTNELMSEKADMLTNSLNLSKSNLDRIWVVHN